MATPSVDSRTTKEVLKVTLIYGFFLWFPQVSSCRVPHHVQVRESCLQKLFSTFPSEWPGVGLLLLRALVGCSLIAQAFGYVLTPHPSLAACCMAAITFAAGAFLLAGLMTPFVSVFVALCGIGIALSLIPLPGEALFNSHLALINLIVLSIAIALLGPGAFSLDARMFGRREITIPRSW